ncbi:epoxide hydrolase [Pyrenophora seminiperda CCB06]|uniref:Epoxide hydrolase n=1 Tax=Pyrenophora seminiperda CCB06 TaxID=1302712 RepID=A0A3M7M7C4_9PLEO|nr:epoxide hydrolase [Pyrenophora seminiperda CCB06]
MPLKTDSANRTYILHPNAQLTHYIYTACTTTSPHKKSSSSATILIQHGFARHSGFWFHWVPLLLRHYNILQRDLRGHGYSSYPSPSQLQGYIYSTGTIVGEIVDLLDQLGLEKVHFLGESTGGMLGLILAGTYPERVSSLTICSTPTHPPTPALLLFAFGRPAWSAALRELGARGWVEELARVPGTVPLSDDSKAMHNYLDEIGVSDGEGLAQYAEFLSKLDARPFLKGIRCPMLILAPTESAAVKVEDMHVLNEMMKGSRLVCVEGGGHKIYVTRAEECQEAFLRFLRDVESEEM